MRHAARDGARARWAGLISGPGVRDRLRSWSSSKIIGREAPPRERRRLAIKDLGKPFMIKAMISRMGPCCVCVCVGEG